MAKKPWKRFAVGSPSESPNWTNSDCRPFTDISHVTHLENVSSLIRTKGIRSAPVFTESVLKDKRVLVSWFSPNYWGNGFRYGNLRFTFSWKKLIKGMRYYWLEIADYEKIPASRILVTSEDRDAEFTPYDPTSGDGPWWLDEKTGNHYWNGDNHCLEILLEREVAISEAKGFDLVDHHPHYCSVNRMNPKQCPHLGLVTYKAEAILLAQIVGNELAPDALDLVLEENGVVKPSKLLVQLWESLQSRLFDRKMGFGGNVKGDDPEAQALARAVMSAFTRQSNDWRRIARLFASRLDFDMACADAVASAYDVEPDAFALRR